MKDDIWIWNSMAKRRRSASDTFEENGIHLLKSSLAIDDFSLRIIDWATPDGFNSITPGVLSKWIHVLYKPLLNQNIPKVFKVVPGILAGILQNQLSKAQHKRLTRKLQSLALQVAKAQLPIFGIKVWYGEAFSYSKLLTDLIHQYAPQTIVIAGGYHATLYEEDILKYSNFDLAIAGNGEEGLTEILKQIKQYGKWDKELFLANFKKQQSTSPISGLIYRDGELVKSNSRDNNRSIPNIIPDYPLENNKTRVHILLESIGCPWNACNFCVHNKFVPVYHSRKVSDIVNEIKEMISQGIGLFRFAGSDTPPRYGSTIAEGILEAKLNVEYTMGCRAVKNCKDEQVYDETVLNFEKLIQSGLRGIFMGGETGNDTVNHEIMNKGIIAEDILYTIKAVRQAEHNVKQKITVSLAFIYPTPLAENVSLTEVFDDNIALITQSQPDSVMVTPPGPFKNTKWYCESDEYGFDLSEDIIPRTMEYEYVLYKPLDMWDEIPFSLKNMDFKEMLSESQRLRKFIESNLKIPTDLSDEHFLMIRSAGLLTEEGIKTFKRKSLLSIISSDYTYVNTISNKISSYSKQLADSNNEVL